MTKLGLRNIRVKDVFIVLLILGVTFGYYLDSYIPEGVTKLDLYFFELGSFGFFDIGNLIYYSKMKFLIIIFSITWYLTCKHWWKSAILVIIAIEIFKFINSLNENQNDIDEVDYLTSLPITIPIIILLILVSKKLNYYNLVEEIGFEIDNEIDFVFFEIKSKRESELKILEQKFIQAKLSKADGNKDKYLADLINIRNEFYKF
ncbi:MAG: hypothetical protein V7719_15605 [Psychroserpens sp.]|uniref:hypothetical protein n=1 Tax=Psychroserpens sp. TaxID=2020870 RepID=UPI003002DE9D